MAQGGRKPKPTNLKLLEGNRGRRALPANEPEYTLTDCAPPPELSDSAQEEWRRVFPILAGSRVLTDVDISIFRSYCEAVGAMRDLKIIERDAAETDELFKGLFITAPSGKIEQAPWFVAQRQWSEVLRKCCMELGLTPSSRTRVAAAPETAEDKIDLAAKYGF